MKRFLIIAGIAISIIIIVIFGLRIYTKSFSPEDQALYKNGNTIIEINYCRPAKKGREIFGGLVPYGQIWRTGANEATTIEFNDDYKVDDQELKAGKYSVYTIPQQNAWTVIFNEQTGQWGTVYNENRDVARVTVSSEKLSQPVELFTIEYERKNDTLFVVMKWDETKIKVPFLKH